MTARATRLVKERIQPVHEEGELVGLAVDDQLVPFPGIGLETELGVVVPGAGGRVQAELTSLLNLRDGFPAGGSAADDWTESDRQFDELGSTYREGDHEELNTWYRRSAAAARWNLERLLERAGEQARAARSGIWLHATGGDGQGHSWSSLHVNVGISHTCFDALLASHSAGRLAYSWYLPAQISLAVIDGNGGIGDDGEYLVSDRLPEFDKVFGACTLRPSRAMLIDRGEFFGNARIMNMQRALSFGRASVAGLAATQLDCLITDLAILGAVEIPAIDIDDPVAAAAQLARYDNLAAAAQLQRSVQEVRRRVWDGLFAHLGDDVASQLIPGLTEELDFIDETLDAIDRADEQELVQRCDWARKQAIVAELGRSAAPSRDDLLALNAHYARLDEDALRHTFPESSLEPYRAEVEPAGTSSWLLWWLVDRARTDASWRDALADVGLSWKGIARSTGSWAESGGYWPWARRSEERIDLVPWEHTKSRLASLCAGATSMDDLFEALGESETHYGDYAGRSYREPASRSIDVYRN